MPGPVSSVISRVRGSAKEYNGYCTWCFSQLMEPVKSLCANNPDTAAGICAMLAARWIERHAHGSSLASWLSDNTGGIDQSKVRQLMQLYIVSVTMEYGMMKGTKSGFRNQTKATKLWLQHKGVVPCRVVTLNGAGNVVHAPFDDVRWSPRAGRRKKEFATEIAISIQKDLNTCSDNYAFMSIYGGKSVGHAMAAWVGHDVCFFDPNFGEFYFPDKHAFVNWFPTFFRKAGYTLPIVNLCDSYQTAILAPRQLS